MSVTKVWKDSKKGEYIVITQSTQKIGGREVKFDFHFIGSEGEEEHLEPLAEYRNLGAPLINHCSPVYVNQKELLKVLSASGLKPEELKKLKQKL